MPIKEQIFCTRVYLTVFVAAIIILVIYSASVRNSQQIVIENPTVKQYEELYRLHRSTLSCPCEHVSVARSIFASVRSRHHEFCSSSLIQEDGFLRYWPMRFLNGTIDYDPPFYAHDFRKYGFKFLKFLKNHM